MLSDIDKLPTVQIGDFNLHLELGELSPQAASVARKELRETPDIVKDSIVQLRDFLKGKIIIYLSKRV